MTTEQSCYMIVTPSTMDARGILDSVRHPHLDRTNQKLLTETPLIPQEGHYKWYVKFEDGDDETPSRYAVHNPDYKSAN